MRRHHWHISTEWEDTTDIPTQNDNTPLTYHHIMRRHHWHTSTEWEDTTDIPPRLNNNMSFSVNTLTFPTSASACITKFSLGSSKCRLKAKMTLRKTSPTCSLTSFGDTVSMCSNKYLTKSTFRCAENEQHLFGWVSLEYLWTVLCSYCHVVPVS